MRRGGPREGEEGRALLDVAQREQRVAHGEASKGKCMEQGQANRAGSQEDRELVEIPRAAVEAVVRSEPAGDRAEQHELREHARGRELRPEALVPEIIGYHTRSCEIMGEHGRS